ncbi:MAG: hypothetical protein ABEJ61_02095 [Haloferacaceae archaeon]
MDHLVGRVVVEPERVGERCRSTRRVADVRVDEEMRVAAGRRRDPVEPRVRFVIPGSFTVARLDERLQVRSVVLAFTRPHDGVVADGDATGDVRTGENRVPAILAGAFVAAVDDGPGDVRAVEDRLDDGPETGIEEPVVVLEADPEVVHVSLGVGSPCDELLGGVGPGTRRFHRHKRVLLRRRVNGRRCGEPPSVLGVAPGGDGEATVALVAAERGEAGQTAGGQRRQRRRECRAAGSEHPAARSVDGGAVLGGHAAV